MDAWLGLDVGTSATKAVVYDGDGAVRASVRTPTRWQSDPDGVTIDPLELRASALHAANEAARRLDSGTVVAGIGITSMGETGVLVDRDGRPVAPAIAWHDGRDAAEVATLDREFGGERFRARTGKPLRGQFSITKHRWLVEHVPPVRAARRRFNVAEWIAAGLGGNEVCDRVLACRTGWYDLHRGGWDDEALRWSGACSELMPPLLDSGLPAGEVTAPDADPRLRGALITLAGHDHQAAAVGVGAEELGDELDSCGTAEAIVRTVPSGLDPARVGTLAEAGITTDVSVQPGRWSLLGGTQGGLALQRTLRLLGASWSELPQLDAQALSAPAGRLRIGGIGRTALEITGIGDDVCPGKVWRAVVEATADAAASLHDAMTDVAGPHRALFTAGGWCESRMVLEAKRRRLGPVIAVVGLEAGSRGAAILAARATGDLPADAQWPLPVPERDRRL